MRLDQWLVSQGHARDLKHAAGLILSANVLINNIPITFAGQKVREDDVIRIRKQKKWVARSAEKLDFALNSFQYSVQNKICLDVGASTGGFTQVLLEHQAREVIALDVAYGFLHPVLRDDPRVKIMERTHICKITSGDVPSRPDMFVADVSFISLQKVCLCLKKLYANWEGIVLFKPQFEARSENLENGILSDVTILERLIADFKEYLTSNKIFLENEIESPIRGKKGNREFLFLIRW